ncbi:azurin [Salegentibacter chungangensis]|uniref:Azurin n=1 Tax=Salegentibacter chungangensis TaxID=1335724 RepID=A0ABW3NUQ1_9FLAO
MKGLHKIVLFLAVALFVSCGEKKKKEEEKITIGDNQGSTEAISSEAKKTSESTEEDVVEISLTGNDQMKYNKNEIRVKAGQTVKLTFEHVGEMSKDVMGHNFVLLKQGIDMAEFAQKAMKAKANDFIPEGTDAIITHTKMLGGGESTTIEFKAPPKGTYQYLCSFPGHYSLMNGKFIVE